MATKGKTRKHINRGGAKEEMKKEFRQRYGKKKGKLVYGATVGRLKRGEAKKNYRNR